MTIASQIPSEPDAGGGVAELFDRHHRVVYRAALRVTGSPGDAEDALQTVFMRLLASGREIARPEAAAAYLHRAGVNAAIDLLRRRRRAAEDGLDDAEAELPAPPEAAADRRLDRRELAAALRRSLARLSPRSAEIFALRHFEGYGNREIAELLGTSQNTVAVTLHRVRARLRDELAPHTPR